jgi:transposase IS66-like protein
MMVTWGSTTMLRNEFCARRLWAERIYSLIATAKLNGIDPESYLRNTLSRIADHSIKRIEELLCGISLRDLQKSHVTLPDRYSGSSTPSSDGAYTAARINIELGSSHRSHKKT